MKMDTVCIDKEGFKIDIFALIRNLYVDKAFDHLVLILEPLVV